jgi:phytoene dehydrogenase-like protein
MAGAADGGLDAVLVGAGHNALACALHLASRGWRVAVVEGAPEPGGAVRSGEYTVPGFRHDWGAMNLSLFAGSAFHKAHGAELARHGLRFVPVDRPFATAFPDGRFLGVTTDAEETARAIGAVSARDGEAWRRLTADFPGEVGGILALLGSPMTMRALASLGWRTARARGVGGALDLARFLLRTPRDWLSRTFESEEVRALLGAWGMHLDFAPDVAGGALFPYLEGMAGQAFGMALGEGGADTVTRALVAALEARGGRVECGVPVTRILREGGRATGVEFGDGRRLLARRAVIAGVAPGALARLAGDMALAFDAGLRGFAHAPGTMMIHLALSGLPPWRAEALRRFAYVHVAPSLDAMARAYQEAQAGLLPAEPVVVVGQPTIFDPSRAPEGGHVLWVQVRMCPGVIRGDAKGEITATGWAEAARPFADRVLDLVEAHARGSGG